MELEWIVKAANERNDERQRRETIARNTPILWDNLCRAIEQAVRYYGKLDDSLPVEFTGRANHTIGVTTFQRIQPQARGPQRERITITLNEETPAVEVRSSLRAEPEIFPLQLNAAGQVCLTGPDGAEVSVDRFTELALKEAFFPPVE